MTTEQAPNGPLFDLGAIFMTQGASEALNPAQALDLLLRHVSGDDGNLDDEDKATNREAIKHGMRILSAYEAPNGERVWIITEASRAMTTLLLPSEY